MPPLETMDRYQTAVLWRRGDDTDTGESDKGEPTEITVRWVTGRKETTDRKGNVIALDAEVILAETVQIGDELWKGTLEEWYGTGSAGNNDEVMRVATYEEVPDIKNRNVQYVAGLQWFKDTP
jgi:hypothetical protein